MKFEEDGYSMFCCLHWGPLDVLGSASLSASMWEAPRIQGHFMRGNVSCIL